MPAPSPRNARVAAATRLRELSTDLLKIAGEMGGTVSSKDAHRLRTSIRRIEVATESAGRFGGAKKLQRQLDSMRRAAGHVRDIDVQTDLLLGLDAGDYASDCSALRNLLLRRREKLEQKASREVTKQVDKDLKGRLEKAAVAIETSDAPARVSVRDRVEHIRAQYIEFTAEIPLDGDPLHDLRKAAKRLRYRLEAIPSRESRKLEKDLKVVQDTIGDWHDWATLTEEAENRLEQKSIAFIAFLRSRSIAKRHEARHAIQVLRQKLMHSKSGKKKPPASAKKPSVENAKREAAG